MPVMDMRRTQVARFSMLIGRRGVDLGSGYKREELGAVVGREFGTAMVDGDGNVYGSIRRRCRMMTWFSKWSPWEKDIGDGPDTYIVLISPPKLELLERWSIAERLALSLILDCETWLMDLDNRAGGTRSLHGSCPSNLRSWLIGRYQIRQWGSNSEHSGTITVKSLICRIQVQFCGEAANDNRHPCFASALT